MAEVDTEWAKAAVVNGTYVIHLGAHIAGKAQKYFAPGEYRDSEDVPYVTDPVLQFDSGHAFVIKEREHFLLLSEKEARFMLQVQSIMDHFVKESARLGGSLKIQPDTGLLLMRSVLTRQLAALGMLAEPVA